MKKPKPAKVTDLTDSEAMEDVVMHLTDAIYNNDTRRMKKLFIELAEEIKRQTANHRTVEDANGRKNSKP